MMEKLKQKKHISQIRLWTFYGMDPVQIRNEVKLGLENGEKDYAGDLIGTKKYLREKYKWEEGRVNKGAHSTQDRYLSSTVA